MSLKRFVIRAVFALYPGISRRGRRASIDGITNDSRSEREIEFVHEETSNRSMNEASVARAAMQEHRAVLGLVNPAEKISDMKKDGKGAIPSSCVISCS
jgi:hypothetical protein